MLLAADGSKDARLAAQSAAELSSKLGSELHVVYVAPEYTYAYASRGVRRRVEEEAQRMKGEGAIMVEPHLLMGRPGAAIVWLAEKLSADLVLIGSRGLGAMRRTLIGSVSDSVVRHAHCPVMVVRNEKEH